MTEWRPEGRTYGDEPTQPVASARQAYGWDDDRTAVLPTVAPAGSPTAPGCPPPQQGLPPELSPLRRGRAPREGGRRRRPGLLLVRLVLALLALVLVFYAALAGLVLSRLDRVDALQDYAGRPGASAGATWLLVGSDSREGLDAEERRRLRTGNAEGQRTDTILLLHVPPDGAPTLVSLPRDSYVTVPAYERRPAHRDKLNAAYAIGGGPLLARTVEQATGLRLDHYVEVGFAGVVGVVDALGGVDLCVPRAIRDRRAGLDVSTGCQELDGPTALGYVRARYSDPKGDLGRVERQRQVLGAVADRAATPATLLNPVAMTRLALSGTEALTVDEDTGLIDLARAGRAMRAVSGGDGVTITVPVADPDYRTSLGSSVLWDEQRARALFEALRRNGRVTV